MAQITGERERFTHTVRAMGFSVLRAVLDLVENPPVEDPYTTLKGHLVLAHQLTLVQKATKCLQVVASSNQCPSKVLASLLEHWLPGEERTAFFRAAFTMRLPLTIQANLTGTELTDLKELAQLADCLWQCNPSKLVAAVTAELQSDEESEMTAAMLAKKRHTSKHYKSQQHKPTSNKAGKVKLLCWKHAKFGEDALNCADKKTCTWSEN